MEWDGMGWDGTESAVLGLPKDMADLSGLNCRGTHDSQDFGLRKSERPIRVLACMQCNGSRQDKRLVRANLVIN